MPSITTARDEMFSLLTEAWLNNPLSSGVPIYYQAQKKNRPGSDVSGFVIAQVLHDTGGSSTIGNRKFIREGIFRILVYTPAGTGLTLNDNLVTIIEAAIIGKRTPSGVWFGELSTTEVGGEMDMFVTEVRVRFKYTELKEI